MGDVRALVPARKAVWSSPSEQKASGKTFFLLFFLYTVPLKFIPQLLIVLCLFLLFLKTLTLLIFVFTSSAYILFVSFF